MPKDFQIGIKMGAIVGGGVMFFICTLAAVNLIPDVSIDVPNDVETIFQNNDASIAKTVNETVCTPLSKQWEKYAKQNGLVNANGEPLVTLHCEARNNPAPAVPQPQ